MSQLIASISGLRGVVGSGLDPAVVERYVHAFARWSPPGVIVVGHDGRPSGSALIRLVAGVLSLSGREVVDIGCVPTPTVQLLVEHLSAAGGIAVTASHNPAQWNGLKFLNREGLFLDPKEIRSFFETVDDPTRTWVDWTRLGPLTSREDALDLHREKVLALEGLDLDAIRARRYSIVVDAVNASGSSVVPRLLEDLGCRVLPVACDGSGVFPHTPEPLPENLTSLGEAVRAHGADAGFAVDPDADRLVLFTEQGLPFGEEYSVTTAADAVLGMHPTADAIVVVNQSTTRAVEDVAARYGARVERSAVGEINVVRMMQSLGAVIGGEGSGGIIHPRVHYGRDSLVGIALVLQAWTRHGGTLSSYRASLPDYRMRKVKLPLTPGLDADAVIRRLAEQVEGARVSTIDGVRLEFDDRWVHVRTSNTEPLLRAIAEAPTDEDVDSLLHLVWEKGGVPGVSRP